MIDTLHAYTILRQKCESQGKTFTQDDVDPKEVDKLYEALDLWGGAQHKIHMPMSLMSITNPLLDFDPSILKHPYMNLILSGPSGIGKTATVCAYLTYLNSCSNDKIEYTKMHYVMELIHRGENLIKHFKGRRLLVIDNFELQYLDNEFFSNFIDDIADDYINPDIHDFIPNVWLVGSMSQEDKRQFLFAKTHIYNQIKMFFHRYDYTLNITTAKYQYTKEEPFIIQQANHLFAPGINTPELQKCIEIVEQNNQDEN